MNTNRSSLRLDLCSSQRITAKRKKLVFSSLVGTPEKVDTSLGLHRQTWFHGRISREDAEALLRNSRVGTYLVRNCHGTNGQEYAVALKSVRGFMHIKIIRNSDGKYSFPFATIRFCVVPELISHYSIAKLPIKGAEHMSLLYPLAEQLL